MSTPSSLGSPILFTPGPVRIPRVVAEAMADPPCNYHRQDGFTAMFAQTQRLLGSLIGLRQPEAWFAALLTATGTGGNEACLNALAPAGPGLILENGFFAARLADQAKQAGIDHLVLTQPADRPFAPEALEAFLAEHADVKWVYFVSHETRAGLVNPLVELGRVAKARGCLVGADVVSSAFAYPIDIEAAELDLAVTSSAKALLAAPGIAIVFVRLASLPRLGRGRSYYLDLVAELAKQRGEGQPRFAQPVALHAALFAACRHLDRIGIAEHMARIRRQMDRVRACLEAMSLPPLLPAHYRSEIAVNFPLPAGLEYPAFARTMIECGYYLLYGIPGDHRHFQVSTIGDLDDAHVAGLETALEAVLAAPAAR